MSQRISALALLALCLFLPVTAHATPPARGWDMTVTYDPIIPVYLCPTEVGSALGVDVDRFENNLVEATNTWFSEGGSHVRLAYFGRLPAGHLACTSFPQFTVVGDPGPVPEGSIVVTARIATPVCTSPFGGTCTCEPSMTQLWTHRPPLFLGPDPIRAARIVIAREDCTSGAPVQYPWEGAPGATYPRLDPTTAFVHELGHALGFVDDDSVPSVMNTARPYVSTPRRHLFREDVAGLRWQYGPLQSLPRHTSAALGSQVFVPPYGQPEPLTAPSLGQAACYRAGRPRRTPTSIFVANTDVGAGSAGTVQTYFTETTVTTAASIITHGESNLPPAVGCGAGSFLTAGPVLLAFVDPDGALVVLRSADGMAWTRSVLPPIPAVGTTPTVAFAPWNGAFVVVASGRDDDVRRFLVSYDGGATFAEDAQSVGQRTLGTVAFACVPSTQECVLIERSCSSCGWRRTRVQFANGGAGPLRLTSFFGPFGLEPRTFGHTLTVDSGNRLLLLSLNNRYSVGYERRLEVVEEIVGTSPMLPFYTPPFPDARIPISDSFTSATYDPGSNRWVVFYTHDPRYSSHLAVVP